MDRLAEHGFQERACDTPRETAARAAVAFSRAGAPLRALASLATVAAFSETQPNDDEVTRAWRHERDLSCALNGGRVVLLRMARAFADPRPLWRIRVRDQRRKRGRIR
jgi:hypothetical protein